MQLDKFVMPAATHLARQTNTPRLSRTDARELAHEAQRCVTWLNVQGFEVMALQQGRGHPRVTIRYDADLCTQLEGAIRMYQRVEQFGQCMERIDWVTHRLGCEVRWTEMQDVRGKP